MAFAWKINTIPEFYTIFARKMPEFCIIIVRKIFFPKFGGHVPPCPHILCLWISMTTAERNYKTGVLVARSVVNNNQSTRTRKWSMRESTQLATETVRIHRRSRRGGGGAKVHWAPTPMYVSPLGMLFVAQHGGHPTWKTSSQNLEKCSKNVHYICGVVAGISASGGSQFRNKKPSYSVLLPLANHIVALWRCGQRTAIVAGVLSVWRKRLVHVGVQRRDVWEIDKLQNNNKHYCDKFSCILKTHLRPNKTVA